MPSKDKMVPETLPTKHVGLGALILTAFFLVLIASIYPHSSSNINGEVSPETSSLRVGASADDSPTSSATSGKLFKGEKVNSFDRSKLLYNSYVQTLGQEDSTATTHLQDSLKCDYWSVVTTIFEPSDAILKQAELSGWCLVVVGDRKTPSPYNVPTAHDNFVYLSAEKQESMAAEFPLSAVLPWNHFGRKNIGFLYAILHGAKAIWDFDDDNILLNKHPQYLLPGLGKDSTTMKFSGAQYTAFEPVPTSKAANVSSTKVGS